MLRTIIATAFAASVVASGATYVLTTSFAETRTVEVQSACGEVLAQKTEPKPLVLGKTREFRW